MSLKCNSAKQIKMGDIIDQVNVNEQNITGHDSRISAVEAASGNTAMLNALNAKINNNATGVASNASDIGTLNTIAIGLDLDIKRTDGKVSGAESTILLLETRVAAVESSTGSGPAMIEESNATSKPTSSNMVVAQGDFVDEINKFTSIQVTSTNKLATMDDLPVANTNTDHSDSAYFYDKKPSGTNGGPTTVGKWHIRQINTAVDASKIGATLVGDRIQLSPGIYYVDAVCAAEGAYNQSRLYDETNDTELVLGSSGSGNKSFVKGKFVLASSTTVRLETQVDTAVADTGLGAQNPFGEAVFASMQIRYLGV